MINDYGRKNGNGSFLELNRLQSCQMLVACLVVFLTPDNKHVCLRAPCSRGRASHWARSSFLSGLGWVSLSRMEITVFILGVEFASLGN